MTLYIKKERSSYETLYMRESERLESDYDRHLRVSLPGTQTEIVEDWREATDREITIYEMMMSKENKK